MIIVIAGLIVAVLSAKYRVGEREPTGERADGAARYLETHDEARPKSQKERPTNA
jgi:hypothetical protein